MKLKLLFTAFTLVTLSQAATTLTLAPTSGAISGSPGSIVGWGFTLSNPANFAVITSSNFCLATSGVTNLCIAPTLGTYADDIANNFTIAGPAPENPVVTQTFSSSTGTGIGSFLISATAASGATNTGQLVVTYDLYNVDPLAANFDPVADLVSAGNFLTAPAAVTAAVSPEPATCLLLAAGFCCALAVTRPIRRRMALLVS